MKKSFLLLNLLLLFSLMGCFQAESDDDLRAVPVTNNPNLLPSSAQTAQAHTGFGN